MNLKVGPRREADQTVAVSTNTECSYFEPA